MTWFDWAKERLAKLKAGAMMPDVHGSNFTPRAVQALTLAQKEAQRFNHNFLGTEHLLLGIIKLKQGVAINVLRRMEVNLEELRLQVETSMSSSTAVNVFDRIPYTPRTKKVIVFAQKNAKLLHHTYVGTEHLLIGLLQEGDGVAGRALQHFKMDLEQTRKEILKDLDPNFSPPEDGPTGKD